jgi:hypothetical protein
MLVKLRLPSLIIGLTLCTAAAADELVGKMGDVELRSTELKAIIGEQPPDVRHQLASEPAALERLVRSELMRKAVLSEAKQKGWDKRAELQPIIERARDQVVVSSFVGNVAKPAESYPSEDEIKQFYESNKAQLLAPPQFQLAQIFQPAPDGDKAKSEEARKKIAEVSAKLAKPGAQGKCGQGRRVGLDQRGADGARDSQGGYGNEQRRRQPADQVQRGMAPDQVAGQEAGCHASACRDPCEPGRGHAQPQITGDGARVSGGPVDQASADAEPDRTGQGAGRVALIATRLRG